jgi:hypothetical protein
MTLILTCLLFSYAVPFLTEFPGAQQTAMGGAYVALAEDAYASLYNPAGLAFQTWPGLAGELSHVPWERDRYYGNAAGVVPFGHRGSAGLYLVGEREKHDGSYDTVDNLDFAVGGALGHTLGDWLAAGIGLKYLSTSIDHRFSSHKGDVAVSGTTVAADLGLLVRRDIGLGELRAGAVLQTLGPGFKQQAVIGALPTTLRGGVCYVVSVPQILTSEGEGWMSRYFRFGKGRFGEYLLDHWRLVIAYDVNLVLAKKADSYGYPDTLIAEKPRHSLGVEVRPLPFFAFRLGYYDDMTYNPWECDGRGWTMGMGLDLKYLRVDIADDRAFYPNDLSDVPYRLRVSVSSSL